MMRVLKSPICSSASLAAVLALASYSTAFAYTKSGTTLLTNGTQADVGAALANASDGDTVSLPPGRFTWGASKTYVAVNKAVTLTGAGADQTTVVLDATGPTGSSAVIRLGAAAVVKNFAIQGASSVAPFAIGSASGWRISGIVYTPGLTAAYFCSINGGYGLIDSCNITGASGTNELIFVRGPSDSWQTPSSIGTADNVVVEDCTFNGQGYVCDANANARVVIRFCTITGPMKIDAHGLASNTPARGVRHIEVYDNHWTAPAGFWAAVEIRGGTGMLFDNISDTRSGVSVTNPAFYLTDYGYTSNAWPNFNNTYQTPVNYPVTDQIGVGADPKSAASEPLYSWDNTAGGVDWTPSWKAIPAAAVTLYETQISDLTATFSLTDVIKENRDYFRGTVGAKFDGTGGVGQGPKATMLAIHPTKAGVGYWVTDEGEWNAEHSGPDGELYVWTGTTWSLKYRPLEYPHPARGFAPPDNAPMNVRITQAN